MSRPYTNGDWLRRLDESWDCFLGTLPIDYGFVKQPDGETADRSNFPILRVMASPQKAFGAIWELLIKEGFILPADIVGKELTVIEEEIAKNDFPVNPLPYLSWQRSDPIVDPLRANVPKDIKVLLDDQETYGTIPFPTPYNITYQLESWSRKFSTDNYIMEFILSHFGAKGNALNEMFLSIIHDDPIGEIRTPVILDSTTDNSDLESIDNDMRYVRKTYGFTFKTWLFKPVNTPKLIHDIVICYTDSNTDSLLEIPRIQGTGIQLRGSKSGPEFIAKLEENTEIVSAGFNEADTASGLGLSQEVFELQIPEGGGHIKSLASLFVDGHVALIEAQVQEDIRSEKEIQGLVFSASSSLTGLTVEFKDPSGPSKTLSVVLTSTSILVNLATNSSSAIISTLCEVKEEVDEAIKLTLPRIFNFIEHNSDLSLTTLASATAGALTLITTSFPAKIQVIDEIGQEGDSGHSVTVVTEYTLPGTGEIDNLVALTAIRATNPKIRLRVDSNTVARKYTVYKLKFLNKTSKVGPIIKTLTPLTAPGSEIITGLAFKTSYIVTSSIVVLTGTFRIILYYNDTDLSLFDDVTIKDVSPGYVVTLLAKPKFLESVATGELKFEVIEVGSGGSISINNITVRSFSE